MLHYGIDLFARSGYDKALLGDCCGSSNFGRSAGANRLIRAPARSPNRAVT